MCTDHIVLQSLEFFFFKQKTAYEMRIIDWSSDVCSSDLLGQGRGDHPLDVEAASSPCADLRHLAGGGTHRLRRGEAKAHGPRLGLVGEAERQIGRASCRERVGPYV